MKEETPEESLLDGYGLIAENQLVGDGSGWAMLRNLFQNKNGHRISVATTRSFFMQENRGLKDEELLAKYKK
jgi:hypothetical protein